MKVNRFVLFLLIIFLKTFGEPKDIVVVTASYNNQKYARRNLHSVAIQTYKNWELIYVDDCSTDDTLKIVKKCVKEFNIENKVTVISNSKNLGALANHYNAISVCADSKIIVILDGDDFLAHQEVLKRINEIYQNPNIWMTYGQFKQFPSGKIGWCKPFPPDVVKRNAFREFKTIPSHLRTFYAWLFKRIKVEDLLYQGNFFDMSPDIAVTFPLIEMASRGHFKFVPEVLLIYNAANPLNEHKISKQRQRECDLEIRRRERYTPL